MNKDVQTTVLSNVLSILAEYTALNLQNIEEAKACELASLVSDSLSILEVIYELEDRYKVTINAENLRQISTVSDLVSALHNEISYSV